MTMLAAEVCPDPRATDHRSTAKQTRGREGLATSCQCIATRHPLTNMTVGLAGTTRRSAA